MSYGSRSPTFKLALSSTKLRAAAHIVKVCLFLDLFLDKKSFVKITHISINSNIITARFILWPNRGLGRQRSFKGMTDQEFMAICHKAFRDFKGDIREFERAVGTLYVARYTGWKPMYLMHDRKSVKKYENHLDIKFQEIVPAEGDAAHRSAAYLLLIKAKKTLTDFWGVVRGESGNNIRTPEFKLK